MSIFGFAKKHNAVNTTTADAELSEKYNAATQEIERLEAKLNQSSIAQSIMNAGIQNCLTILCAIQNQLITVAAHLARSNQKILELSQENQALQASTDEWFKRAVKLEFDILTAQDELKEVEHERDLAIKMIERLQVELITAHTQNKPNQSLN